MKLTLKLFILSFLFWTACQQSSEISVVEEPTPIPEALPMKEITLSDLSAFQNPTNNWTIQGNAFANYEKDKDLQTEAGKGILINKPTETDKGNLFTNLEHGDLELELEFMMPKGSNSGIYFQSRYEVQLLDSWGKENPSFADCGGIYQRWDDSKAEGQKGYEGIAPPVNASKAPGLWQSLRVFFRAPRFDEQGNKIKNARFEEVYLNGVLLHKNVEVTGPTRAAQYQGEADVPYASLMIQGDHGPLAIRKIKYKNYTQQKLALTELNYKLYEGKWDYIPDFSALTPIRTGAIDSIDVEKASQLTDHFALVFEGSLEVPVEGEYLFKTMIDDGGDLRIDSQLVVHNQGDPGLGTEGGLIHLTEGTHSFELTFFEDVWFAHASVYYEGPEIYNQALACIDLPKSREKSRPSLVLKPEEAPEMVRGFVNYANKKRTHTISTGFPEGLHYSYDLQEGTLIKCWKGDFADVSNMWVGRGHSQLLLPLNAAIETTAGMPIAKLKNSDTSWPKSISEDFRPRGYRIDNNQRPLFKSELNTIKIEDQIVPSSDQKRIVRTIAMEAPENTTGHWVRLAAADKIELLSNGEYRVGGFYYLRIEDNDNNAPIIRDQEGGQELLIAVLENSKSAEISYSLLW